MSRLLLTFANPPGTTPLDTLSEEDAGVWQALSERDSLGAIKVSREQHATVKNLIDYLETYKEDLALFLYSGHAGANELVLEDQEGNALGLAMLLGECANRNLVAVILNGCSTEGQVDMLLKAGVPVVIATSAPVDDFTATRFSIAFFKALSEDSETLWNAYMAGMRAAQFAAKAKNFSAALQIRCVLPINNKTEAVWGFFCREENRGLAETWKLPDAAPVDCLCNQHLRRALGGIYNKFLAAGNADRNQWANIAMEQLPFPLSEPLRKLLAGKSQTQEAGKFYDTASWDRFQLLLYTYRATLQLPLFVLLANLWDQQVLTETPVVLPENLQDSIRTFFFAETHPDPKTSLLPLLKALSDWYKPIATQASFTKGIDAIKSLDTDAVLRAAVSDLEQKVADQDQLRRQNSAPASMCNLCTATEENLAKVLFGFGFLAEFAMTSIKDIEVLKYRYNKAALFLHRLVKLQISYSELDEENYKTEAFLENSSIIMHPHGNLKAGVINLTPFYVDKNALLNVPKTDLHNLTNVMPGSGRFHFLSVPKHKEPWIVSPAPKEADDFFGLPEETDNVQQEYYKLLEEQFNALSNALFGKPFVAL